MQKLIELAKNAMINAYSPYSKFKVGAALLCENGKIYTGCNIENLSFGATICAERVALFKAISEGEKNFKSIAIISDSKDFIYPCGICRQVIREFVKDDFIFICCNFDEVSEIIKMNEILPKSFCATF